MAGKLQFSFDFQRNADKVSKQISYINGNWDDSASLNKSNVELKILEGKIKMRNKDDPVKFTFGKNKRHLFVAAGGSSTTTLKYSVDGLNWVDSDGYFSTLGYGAAFNGSLWVAVGKDSSSSNSILYSDDGRKWYPATSGTFSDYGLGVAWNGELWVAAGKASPTSTQTLKYSTDGKTWTNATSGGFDTYGYRVTYGSNKWIAVGNDSSGNNIKYSSDGKTWSNGGNVFSSDGRDVAWNGEKWVAVGVGSNPIKYSSDGITWSNASVTISYANAVAWNGEMWIAGGYNPSMVYSRDGKTWAGSGFSGIFTSNTNSIIWTGSRWIAGGDGGGTVKYSFDGFNWMDISSGQFVSYCLSVSYSSLAENNLVARQIWVSCGYGDSSLKYSYDGFNWSNATGQFNNDAHAAKWNGEIWVAGAVYGGGGSESMKYSSDGINWSNITSGQFSTACFGIEWNGKLWVAVGYDTSASIKYSSDGISWSNASGSGFTNYGNDVFWNGSLWMAVGKSSTNHPKISSNGTSWSNAGSPSYLGEGYAVAYGNGTWVVGGHAVSNFKNIHYSTNDGTSWTAASNSFYTTCYAIKWNGKMFVAAGDHHSAVRCLRYSYDGQTWQVANNTPSLDALSVGWDGEKWIAGTASGAVYSYDGINWLTSGMSIGSDREHAIESSKDIYGYHRVRRELSPGIKLAPEDTIWVCSDSYYDVENIDSSITLSE